MKHLLHNVRMVGSGIQNLHCLSWWTMHTVDSRMHTPPNGLYIYTHGWPRVMYINQKIKQLPGLKYKQTAIAETVTITI